MSGQRSDLIKAGGGKALAKGLGLWPLERIPIAAPVVISGGTAAPFATREIDLAAAQAFTQVTRSIPVSELSAMTVLPKQRANLRRITE